MCVFECVYVCVCVERESQIPPLMTRVDNGSDSGKHRQCARLFREAAADVERARIARETKDGTREQEGLMNFY